MSRRKNPFGSIAIRKAGCKNPSNHFEFDLPSCDVNMSDTLMCHFKNLNLSSEEKQNFKREYRKELCLLKSIEQKHLVKAYKNLIKSLSCHLSSDEPLTIRANSVGSFICLAAIFSGEIPAHAEWRFELEECPLPLFPKELVKVATAAHMFNISFRYSETSWIKPFPSLRKSPSYMPFQSAQDYEEWRLKVA